MSALVVYRTRCGSAKRYAVWLAEDLGTEARDLRDVADSDFEAADTVALCATNYYGFALGARRLKRLMARFPRKHFAVVFVGSTPMPREYGGTSGHERMFTFNFPAEKFPHLAWCWCMGDYDPARQHPWDRAILRLYGDMLAARADKEPVKPFRKMCDDLHTGFAACDRANLAPMIEYLKSAGPVPSGQLNLTLR